MILSILVENPPNTGDDERHALASCLQDLLRALRNRRKSEPGRPGDVVQLLTYGASARVAIPLVAVESAHLQADRFWATATRRSDRQPFGPAGALATARTEIANHSANEAPVNSTRDLSFDQRHLALFFTFSPVDSNERIEPTSEEMRAVIAIGAASTDASCRRLASDSNGVPLVLNAPNARALKSLSQRLASGWRRGVVTGSSLTVVLEQMAHRQQGWYDLSKGSSTSLAERLKWLAIAKLEGWSDAIADDTLRELAQQMQTREALREAIAVGDDRLSLDLAASMPRSTTSRPDGSTDETDRAIAKARARAERAAIVRSALRAGDTSSLLAAWGNGDLATSKLFGDAERSEILDHIESHRQVEALSASLGSGHSGNYPDSLRLYGDLASSGAAPSDPRLIARVLELRERLSSEKCLAAAALSGDRALLAAAEVARRAGLVPTADVVLGEAIAAASDRRAIAERLRLMMRCGNGERIGALYSRGDLATSDLLEPEEHEQVRALLRQGLRQQQGPLLAEA